MCKEIAVSWWIWLCQTQMKLVGGESVSLRVGIMAAWEVSPLVHILCAVKGGITGKSTRLSLDPTITHLVCSKGRANAGSLWAPPLHSLCAVKGGLTQALFGPHHYTICVR